MPVKRRSGKMKKSNAHGKRKNTSAGNSNMSARHQGRNKPLYEPLRAEYEEYLRNQRGLTENSIYHYWRLTDRFLRFQFNSKKCRFNQITLEGAVKFMQHITSLKSPYRNKTISSTLRVFLQFLFKSGKINVNLALSIPSIAQNYASRLPRYLMPEQVEKLIAAVKTDTPIGRRNYAMILLLARLGLRAMEVIAIQIDDIDWRAGEIIIRGKGQLHDRLPIPKDVGESLANYIQKDRVTTSRALFVAQRAPGYPLVDSQVLNMILKNAFEKTNLKPPTQYVGSHILRHSIAVNMVRKGASLEEIGSVLRHRSRSSTMIYAKVDVEGLRSIAPSWPMLGGKK
jgi:integrase/recombinase XerD